MVHDSQYILHSNVENAELRSNCAVDVFQVYFNIEGFILQLAVGIEEGDVHVLYEGRDVALRLLNVIINLSKSNTRDNVIRNCSDSHRKIESSHN